MKQIFISLSCLMLLYQGYCQLTVQKGAGLYLQERSSITVQGDVKADENILGLGILQLNGISLQNINMNGFSIPNLKISNPNNIALSGNAAIGRSLSFSRSRISRMRSAHAAKLSVARGRAKLCLHQRGPAHGCRRRRARSPRGLGSRLPNTSRGRSA